MNNKNKRRNFPRGEGSAFYKSFFFFFFFSIFCKNSDNAHAHFPFPIPHKPVVILLSLFHFAASEMLNHKTGVSENGIYLGGMSPALF